jgi:hypothetical protein
MMEVDNIIDIVCINDMHRNSSFARLDVCLDIIDMSKQVLYYLFLLLRLAAYLASS